MAEAPTHTKGTMSLDARTIAMVVAFLVGGGGVGAGTSIIGGSGVQERVERLSLDVKELTRAVDLLSDQRGLLVDHEARIRRLEEKRTR